MTDRPLHLVAIGAHPDDIELTMGGLAIHFARGGHRVTWIVATDGAAGKGGRDRALAERRRGEAIAAAELAGASLVWLGFPDGQLAWAAGAPERLGVQLAELAPDLIVTHPLHDYHADHRAVARIVGDCAPIGVPVLRADTMLGVHFAPDLLLDITEVFEAKLATLAKHDSQSSLALVDTVRVWNRFRGLQSGTRHFLHAEAYAVDRRLSADPRPMLGRIAYCQSL